MRGAPRSQRMRHAPATFALCLVLAGLAGLISRLPPPEQQRILLDFGLSPARIWRAERPWSVATYAFLHFEPRHLLANLAGLAVAGSLLERLVGTGRSCVILATGALAGGLAHVASHPLSAAPLHGASAAMWAAVAAVAPAWAGLSLARWRWGIAAVGIAALLLLAGISAGQDFPTGMRSSLAAHLGGGIAGLLAVLAQPPRRATPV